jgi:hypothetical protein
MPASLPVAGWCIVLRGWWAWMQSESRCTDCGYCPVWCGCDE